MIKNFLPIIQAMRGKDPQTILSTMLKNSPMNNNPFMAQLIGYAKAGDTNSLVNLANSYFSSQGVNMSQELSEFMSMLK